MFFEGFKLDEINTGETTLRVRSGGKGPGLLLLHGCPQTHAMWHKIAPRLAEEFTVIAPDLRGYGGSGKPPTTPDHEPYSKRAMNRDQIALMRHFGFEKFHVAGHDRGGRCAYRMAMDHPERVEKVAVLDILPTSEVYARTDKTLASIYFHWFFLNLAAPFPEQLLANDKDCYFLGHFAGRDHLDPEALAEYLHYYHDPAMIHGMCEDYRAGFGIDCAHDEADRKAGRKIKAPLLTLWGGRAYMGQFGVIDVWKQWAENVSGEAIDCGHFLPEEKPDETYRALRDFFAA